MYASYELLPELATISWIACLLASAEGPVLHSLSPCQSSQVNWPQTLRGNYCTCSWSLSSINGEKMTSCARVYWICHFNSWISYPRLCFIAFQMKFNYPVPSHFQFSGRDGSGTWKKVRDGSGTGIPSDPDCARLCSPVGASAAQIGIETLAGCKPRSHQSRYSCVRLSIQSQFDQIGTDCTAPSQSLNQSV